MNLNRAHSEASPGAHAASGSHILPSSPRQPAGKPPTDTRRCRRALNPPEPRVKVSGDARNFCTTLCRFFIHFCNIQRKSQKTSSWETDSQTQIREETLLCSRNNIPVKTLNVCCILCPFTRQLRSEPLKTSQKRCHCTCTARTSVDGQ